MQGNKAEAPIIINLRYHKPSDLMVFLRRIYSIINRKTMDKLSHILAFHQNN